MATTVSVIQARSSSRLVGKGGKKKLCLYRIPIQKSSGVLNQEIVVAKLYFHHVQSKQPSAARHEETTLKTCKYLQIKLKHILHIAVYIIIL